jgi:histidyl-tRNA synthetase
MGLKEAMENSVIVRNMTDRSQDTVKIEDVPTYLKKLKEMIAKSTGKKEISK